MQRLFVYGSLKCGGEAHHLLSGCPRDKDGGLNNVRLTTRGGYPMLCAGDSRIAGEVYWIPDDRWSDLDAWEDAPATYQKKRRHLIDGREIWVYEEAQDSDKPFH